MCYFLFLLHIFQNSAYLSTNCRLENSYDCMHYVWVYFNAGESWLLLIVFCTGLTDSFENERKKLIFFTSSIRFLAKIGF